MCRMCTQNTGDANGIQRLLDRQMSEIHRVVSICLGIPDKTFAWEYYDKNKVYHKIGPLTSLEFYEKYVKPCYDVDNKVQKISMNCQFPILQDFSLARFSGLIFTLHFKYFFCRSVWSMTHVPIIHMVSHTRLSTWGMLWAESLSFTIISLSRFFSNWLRTLSRLAKWCGMDVKLPSVWRPNRVSWTSPCKFTSADCV